MWRSSDQGFKAGKAITATGGTRTPTCCRNPGTDNVPCDSNLVDPSLICYRGDNVFADVFPGQCKDWQYDVPLDHPVGMLW